MNNVNKFLLYVQQMDKLVFLLLLVHNIQINYHVILE